MTTRGPYPPLDRTRGFHAPTPDDRKPVDPILLVHPDPETCRVVGQHLAEAGYFVEWTLDPAIATDRLSARRYGLLVVDEQCMDRIATESDVPRVAMGRSIDIDALVALVRERVRERKETQP